jgi:hypothetical protein
MSSVVISGDTSGQVTLAAPAVAGSNTITLPASTGTAQLIGQGTAVASTSGTSIDFTSIPSWVKRITVMFNGVSTSGTSNIQLQLGAGSVTTTGYLSNGSRIQGSSATTLGSTTTGFIAASLNSSSDAQYGTLVFCNISGNTWLSTGTLYATSYLAIQNTAGQVALSGTLDRVRITTVNGTDTFDAGSINILYEG